MTIQKNRYHARRALATAATAVVVSGCGFFRDNTIGMPASPATGAQPVVVTPPERGAAEVQLAAAVSDEPAGYPRGVPAAAIRPSTVSELQKIACFYHPSNLYSAILRVDPSVEEVKAADAGLKSLGCPRDRVAAKRNPCLVQNAKSCEGEQEGQPSANDAEGQTGAQGVSGKGNANARGSEGAFAGAGVEVAGKPQ